MIVVGEAFVGLPLASSTAYQGVEDHGKELDEYFLGIEHLHRSSCCPLAHHSYTSRASSSALVQRTLARL